MENKEAITFIKRFTTVPEKFVDELFKFYTEDTRQMDLVILLDDVAKWLDCKKADLHDTLKRSYLKDVDYTVMKSLPIRIKNTKYGNNNFKRIMITPDCFKRLCMLSRAKKAEMIRTYFIDVETQFIKYKRQLMEGLKTDITRLENDLNPKRNLDIKINVGGYMYIVNASDEVDEMFKLGRASNLKTRLFSYQTGKAHSVKLLYVLAVHDMKSAEKCVKDHLQEYQYRVRREVYQLPIELLKSIMNKCNEIDGAKKEYINRKKLSGGHSSHFVMFNKELVLP